MNIIEDQSDARRSKLNTILHSIRNAEKNFALVDEEKLISEIQFVFACARRTALEYLSTLEGVEKIVREGEKVWTKSGYKSHLEHLESSSDLKVQKEVISQ